MRREHLFEFEDLPWFPAVLRDGVTSFLTGLHRLLRTDEPLAGLLHRALEAGRAYERGRRRGHEAGGAEEEIVDLASGAGGPLPDVVRRLREEHGRRVHATLTDLRPNPRAAAALRATDDPAVRYLREPVDAARPPDDLEGSARTIVASLHHLPPSAARRALHDARRSRTPIVVLELAHQLRPTSSALLVLPAAALLVLVLTPFLRPSWPQLLFTYLVPVLPVVIAWDGAVSMLRIYSRRELRAMLDGVDDPGYAWEMGSIRPPWLPLRMPYLLGLPRVSATR